MLDTNVELTAPSSIVIGPVMLPRRTTTVVTMRRSADGPPTDFVVTALFDPHVVDAAPVPTPRTPELYRSEPAPDPTTVTLMEPVDATFDTDIELITPTSNVTCLVTLHALDDDVEMTILRVAPTPAVVFVLIAVCDHHIVAAITVPPTTAVLLKNTPPEPTDPEPTTVTLTEPVVAVLDTTPQLMIAESIVTASVMLLTAPNTVKCVARITDMPPPIFVTIALSDTQSLAAHLDPPTRFNELRDASPTHLPTTVTLIEPVVATLVRHVELTTPTPIVTCCVMLPNRLVTVTATRCPELTPAATRLTTPLSENHLVPVAPEPPTRIVLLYTP